MRCSWWQLFILYLSVKKRQSNHDIEVQLSLCYLLILAEYLALGCKRFFFPCILSDKIPYTLSVVTCFLRVSLHWCPCTAACYSTAEASTGNLSENCSRNPLYKVLSLSVSCIALPGCCSTKSALFLDCLCYYRILYHTTTS